jgi:membrane-associated phospholipid phosphatase
MIFLNYPLQLYYNMRHDLNSRNFRVAAGISILISVILFTISISIGKQEFFLLLNTDGGKFFDQFFAFFTHGGEEGAWIILLLVVLFILKRKDALVLLIGSVLFSTILTQGIKNFIFAGEPRPTKAITDIHLIHLVPGVQVSTINTFPSGHTSSAFCVYFVFCLLIPKKWWIPVGLLYALLVAYSRIYLAQHFPLDICGGIVVAIISVWLSARMQVYWWKRKNNKRMA